MNQSEQDLLWAIHRLAVSLAVDWPRWTDLLLQEYGEAERFFASDLLIERRLEFVWKFKRKMLWGWGTLNDVHFSEKSEELKKALSQQVWATLRQYWKALGRESYDPKEFSLYPVGTRVKMVKGKIRIIDPDGHTEMVPNAGRIVERIWIVKSPSIPDITNMPEYEIQHGSSIWGIRHDAIEPMTD